MKKNCLIMTVVLLSFCGVQMMASFLEAVLTESGISVPSSITIQAGKTANVPVSLSNSNAYYVGFQMDIVLPKGITPVLNPNGQIVPTKSDRLAGSHSFNCNYDEETNTVNIVCASINADSIRGTNGSLFSIDIQADTTMTIGSYEMSLTNIVFSTNSDAPEGAIGYSHPSTGSVITVVSGEDNPTVEPKATLQWFTTLTSFEDYNTSASVEGVVSGEIELNGAEFNSVKTYSETTFACYNPIANKSDASIDFVVRPVEADDYVIDEISFQVSKMGTDAGTVTVKWIDANGNESIFVSNASVARNNATPPYSTFNLKRQTTDDGSASYSVTYNDELTYSAEPGTAFGIGGGRLRITVSGMSNTKQIGLANVQIKHVEQTPATLTPINQDYEAEDAGLEWTNATASRYTPYIAEVDGNRFVTVANDERYNNGTTLTSNVLVGSAPKGLDYTLTFDLKLSNGNNQISTFTVYDAANTNAMLSLAATAPGADTWSINGTSEVVTLPNSNKSSSDNTISDVTWVSVKFSRFGELTYLTIINRDTHEEIFSQSLIDNASAKGGLGKMEFKTGRYNANFAIDNINVRAIESGDVPEAILTTYTLLFVDQEGNSIRDAVVLPITIGTQVKVPDTYTASFLSEDSLIMYIYAGNYDLVASEDSTQNIINLTFREALKFSYTLNATLNGNFLTQISNGEDFETKTIEVPYSQNCLVDGKLYKTNEKGAQAHYIKTFDLTSNEQQVEIAYQDIGVDNVVFYSEAENIAGLEHCNQPYMTIRSSGTACAYATEKTVITKLPAGNYILAGAYSMPMRIDTLFLFAGNDTIAALTPTGKNNWTDFNVQVKLSGTREISFKGGNKESGLDFIYIQKGYDAIIDFANYQNTNLSTITCDGVTISGTGNNYIEGGSYGMYWDSGSNYAITITSENLLTQIDFGFRTVNDSYRTITASTGTMSGNTWKGEANSVTFTMNNYDYSPYLKTISVYYDTADAETLLARLQDQLEQTDNALIGLNYEHVYGSDSLRNYVIQLRQMMENETLTDEMTIRDIVYSVKEQTSAVVALDLQYVTIENAIKKDEGIATANEHVGQSWLAEATAYFTEVRQGLTAGLYTSVDVGAILNRLNNYFAPVLSETMIVVHVEEAGTLGDSILAQVENFSDVTGLVVTGKLNSTDLTNLKERLTNVKFLDLGSTNLTSISSEQFRDQANLQTIVLPEKLRTIGSYAFYNCTKLQDVTLPSTLSTIDRYAFYNCRSFMNVNIPEGVTSIGSYAYACNSDNSYYDNNGNYVTASMLTSVTLPSTLRTLGNSVFEYQRNLEQVSIADGLTSIGSYAFAYCNKLCNLHLPASLTDIASRAFYYCSALKEIKLPEGLTSIADYAFYNCDALESIVLPSTLTSLNGYYTFRECDRLKSITCKSIVPPYTNNNNVTGKSGLDLYVPQLSVNVYKQTFGWDQFNIHGIDVMPDNIVVNSSYRMSWPDNLSIDYKPNVIVNNTGKLEVTGVSTLSSNHFKMVWDPNQSRENGTYYNSSTGTYEYRRDVYASLINNATVRADNICIELWTATNTWDFITIPYDVKVSNIGLAYVGTPFVIRKYDGQMRADGKMDSTWVNMTADSTLHAGQGYIIQSASTSSDRSWNGFYFNAEQTLNKNKIFANGDVELPLANYVSEFSHNRSWNLVGNPYPCYYDIRAMQTTAPITVWDEYNNNYKAYSPEDDAYILNPGQAFFVQRPVNEENITFLKEGRQQDLTVRDIEYAGNRAQQFKQRSVFNLILAGNDMADRTRLVINSEALADYESMRDASKFMSMEQKAVQIYTMQDDVRYAINERPLGDGLIKLGLSVGIEGFYTIALDTKVGNEVYLIDKKTGDEIRLDGSEGYTFFAEGGSLEGRFVIRMGNGAITGIKNMDYSQSRSDVYYNLKGQRVSNLNKGFYITNGKKVVVK